MKRIEPQYRCPVCLGVFMAKLRLGDEQAPVVVDHCRRCGGLWLQAGEVQRLRGIDADTLWQFVARDATRPVPVCHSCHAPRNRDADRCEACGLDNTLDCPECESPMSRELHEDVYLDACHRCRGVWFDHHELTAIWRFELASAVERRRAGVAGPDGSLSVLDLLILSEVAETAMWGVVHGGAAAAEGLAQLAGPGGDAAAAAASAAADVVEVAGEAAEGVLSTILEILGGIFS
jgi:uncharacterized protein